MTEGKDVSMLFTDVVKCMQTSNLELKKLVYLYVMNYAKSQPDRAILAVNTFQKDATDPNPLIRALAVRTMGCIRVENITEYLSQPLVLALKDADPYVRKTAAVCVAKLYDINPDMVEQQGFIEQLQDLCGDSNPVVVANAVAALSEINETSSKPVFRVDAHNIAKLLAALSECTEWGQVCILDAAAKFVPSDSKEAENVCERVVPRLNHNNSAVVLSAAKVILLMLEHISSQDIVHLYCKKLSPPLITLLSSGKEYEIQYVALRNINIIIQRRPEVLQNEMKVFFCKYNDPIYVKLEKLEIMIMLTNENNVDQVLPEFKDYAQMVDIEFVRKSVRAIGRCAIKLERAAPRCVQVLLELISTKVNYVVQEATVVIRDIFRRYPNQYESIISNLCENLSTLDEPDAKAAMVWIIGEYADRIENAAELLESFLENFKDETNAVKLQLLTATVKLFLKKSKEGGALIQQVLQLATKESDNPDLRDRGFIYWRLLSTNPEAAKAVVLATRPPIKDTTATLGATLCKGLIPYIGSLASVYHKLPEAFISKLSRTPRRARREQREATSADAAAETDANALDTNAPVQAPQEASKKSNLLLDLDDILGISTVSQPAGAGATAPAATSQNVSLNPLDDLLGLSVPSASANTAATAAQPALTLVLPAEKGNGMELQMGLGRDASGKLTVFIKAANKGPVALNYIAVQFNKNTFGIAPQTQPRLTAPLQPGASCDLTMEVNTSGTRVQGPPNYNLQVAVKNSTEKIFYFFMPIPQNLF